MPCILYYEICFPQIETNLKSYNHLYDSISDDPLSNRVLFGTFSDTKQQNWPLNKFVLTLVTIWDRKTSLNIFSSKELSSDCDTGWDVNLMVLSDICSYQKQPKWGHFYMHIKYMNKPLLAYTQFQLFAT